MCILLGMHMDCLLQIEVMQLQIVPNTKPAQYSLVPSKENKERRIVLAKSAMQILRQQRTKQQKQKLRAGAQWDNQYNLVFTNKFTKPLHHFSVYSHLKRILKECGMEGYTFHSPRHSFASISIENGDDIKTVQMNLGHHAAAFTLKPMRTSTIGCSRIVLCKWRN